MEHLSVSLIVALIGGIVDLDSTAVVQCMISQPIVAAPLTALKHLSSSTVEAVRNCVTKFGARPNIT